MAVDIIITAYNSANTIVETVNSVVYQKYDNWKIVLVDDGSTDGLEGIITDHFKDILSSGKLLYISSPRIGRAAALNLGIMQCTGKYVAILDADDIWLDDKLENQLALIEETGSDYSLTAYNVFTSGRLRYSVTGSKKVSVLKGYKLLGELARVTHSSLLIKRNIVSYNESLSKQLDIDLYLRLMGSDKVCLFFEEKLVNKRVHENQYFEAKNNLKYRINAFKMLYPIYISQIALKPLLIDGFKLLFALLPLQLRNIIKRSVSI